MRKTTPCNGHPLPHLPDCAMPHSLILVVPVVFLTALPQTLIPLAGERYQRYCRFAAWDTRRASGRKLTSGDGAG